MNRILLVIFLLLSIFLAKAQTAKNVLFLGNSYTEVNNLPLLVKQMAASNEDELSFDSYTPGGYRFINHASDPTTLSKINSATWDYVVLQAQSQETSLSQAQMEAEVFPYATSLSNTIRNNYDCSQPLFYMTWGRKNGDASNCAFRPWVCTYEQMDDVIRASYLFMAEDNEAELAPAGAVWRFIRENYPDIELYSADQSHPSLAGSYAAACAFYTVIFKKDPTLIRWNSTLSEEEANLIKLAAKSIVFDSLPSWDFTAKPFADFSETINSGEVQFTNNSSDFDSIFWDFGDSNTSTEINPMHTYSEGGTYTVSQTVTKCEKSDRKIKDINIILLASQSFWTREIQIYPNPVKEILNVNLNGTYLNIQSSITDISGQEILKTSFQNVDSFMLKLSSLETGFYFLKIKGDEENFIRKIVKW